MSAAAEVWILYEIPGVESVYRERDFHPKPAQ